MHTTTTRIWTVLATFAVALSALILAAPAAPKPVAGPTLTIWADKDRVTAVTKVANDWAGHTRRHGEDRREELRRHPRQPQEPSPLPTPPTSSSARTTGRASSRRTASSSRCSRRRRRWRSSRRTPSTRSRTAPPSRSSTAPRSRSRTSASSSTRSSAKVPKTWAELERSALAFKKKKSGNLAIAVQQGANGDAYHMYPFFAGLGGYIFGTNKGRQPRPVGHRRGEPALHQELEADRQVEQGGPDQREGRQLDRAERLPEGPGRLLDHRPVEHRHDQEGRDQVPGGPGPADREGVRSVPRRPGLPGHEVRRYPRQRCRGEGPGRELHDGPVGADDARRREQPVPREHQGEGGGPVPRRSSGRPATAVSRCRTSPR